MSGRGWGRGPATGKLIGRFLLGLLLLILALPLLAGPDDDAYQKKNLAPPAEWVFPAARPLRVLNVRGRWYPYYAMDRAYARLGGAYQADSWHYPGNLRYYPNTYEGLMANHLVVVGNIDGGSFGPVNRVMLKQYVEAGGAILFLGGRQAFGKSYRGTALEEIAPVTFTDKDDVTPAPAGGLVLAPGKDVIGKGFTGLSWKTEPRVFWYHDGLTVKPGAKVLLTAGGKPLLIAGTFGKGRVALFAGSVMGDPQPNERPFWEWTDWPVIMANTITWLTEPVRAAAMPLSAEGKATLTTRLLGTSVKKAAEVGPLLTRTAGVCGDRETATILVKAVINLEGEVPLDLVDVVSDGVRPYVDGTFSSLALALIESPRSSQVSLGLRLLGMAKAPNARKILEEKLKDPGSGGPQDPMEPGTETVVEDSKVAAYAVRLGALEGLGNLGDPSAIPLLQTCIRQYGKARSNPDTMPIEVTQEDELYQEALLSALRCGDAAAAAPVVDALLENRYVFIRMMGFLDSPDYPGPEHEATRRLKRRVTRDLPRVYARQDRLYRKLIPLPAAVLPPLAERIAAEDDPRVIGIAFALFGKGFAGSGAAPPPAAFDALKKARVQAVADLAMP